MSWEENLHPRGKDGKFINKGARIKVGVRTGTVTGARNTANGTRLTVKYDNGIESTTVMPHQVSVIGNAAPSQNKPVAKGKPVAKPAAAAKPAGKNWLGKINDRIEGDMKPAQDPAAKPPVSSLAPKPVRVTGLTGSHKADVDAAMAHQATFAPKAFAGFSGVKGMTAAESAKLRGSHGHDALGGFDGTHILVGKSLLGDKAEKDHQKEQRSGWSSPSDTNGLQSFVSHESGHYIDSVIQRSGPNTSKPIWAGIAKEFGLKPPSFMDKRSLDKWLSRPENNKALSAGVSKYGASASDELLAELWASYTTSNKPSPAIARIGKIMADLAEKNS